jgi:hypothetical protein
MLHRSCFPRFITAFSFLDTAPRQRLVTNRKKCGDYYTLVTNLRVVTDRRVRPQLLKYKTSPAVLIAAGLVYQNEKPLD